MTLERTLKLAAVVSFVLCLFAGAFILLNAEISGKNALVVGIGIYFLGKAFFVGPALLAAAERLGAAAR
ncbi:MAG TPA: hypothetical protein VF211_07890 [Burkholderiales bacterium]